MSRKDVEFKTEDNVTLRGWLYLPDAAKDPVPAIVMAHGYSAVKEMYLDKYAEVFATAGLGVLVYDNRNFGASDGEPRQEIDPWAQVRDYRDTITFASSLPEIDDTRIGVWGSSYSGGHALVVAAIDRRVKCVVSQVPLVTGLENARRLVRADIWATVREMFSKDRAARYAGKPPAMIPVVTPPDKPFDPCALPTPDSWEWFTETQKLRAPSWKNEVTLRSVEMLHEYEPKVYIPAISPTPLLMIVGRTDHLTMVELALAAYEEALEPKKLVILDGGHFGAYVETFDESSSAASEWFVQHLISHSLG
ncbi:MAG: fermentation-respiration switch protein FrsA (DUF1100 family) [Gammaproteobacteria bacterium]|jgi:fermentation-respiration switch protein FrsA (DUF1100 family)